MSYNPNDLQDPRNRANIFVDVTCLSIGQTEPFISVESVISNVFVRSTDSTRASSITVQPATMNYDTMQFTADFHPNAEYPHISEVNEPADKQIPLHDNPPDENSIRSLINTKIDIFYKPGPTFEAFNHRFEDRRNFSYDTMIGKSMRLYDPALITTMNRHIIVCVGLCEILS